MAAISALRSYLNSLPAGYQLHWYTIEQVIGQGAFGITYLAEDVNLSRKVAIKEYMPAQLAMRAEDKSAQPVSLEEAEKYFWGKDRFLNEARLLADVKHPSIVQVLSVFETNNTAYMVMQYERGESLDNILKRHGTLDQNQLLEVLYPIMEGLEFIHSRHIIHRDIKPGNIYIREDGPPVLLDFGSARRSLQNRTAKLTSLVTPGYAPIEQYGARANKQGPWTDIYGLGATLHRSITGSPPPDAINRSEGIATESQDTYCPTATKTEHEFSFALIKAIQNALEFKPQDRPQSISEWRSIFEDDLLANTDSTKSLFTVGSLTENHVHKEVTTGIVQTGVSYADPYVRSKRVSQYWLAAMLVLSVGIFIGYKNNYFEPEARVIPSTIADSQAMESLNELLAAIMPPEVESLDLIPSFNEELDTELAVPQPDLQNMVSSKESANYIAGASLMNPSPNVAVRDTNTLSLEELLRAANRDLNAQRLTRPAGENALEKYRAALVLSPNNVEASHGLDKIVATYGELVEKAIEENRFDEAEKLIDRAEGISPGHEKITAAENALKIAHAEYAIDNISVPVEEDEAPSLAVIEPPPKDSKKRGDAFVERISGEN